MTAFIRLLERAPNERSNALVNLQKDDRFDVAASDLGVVPTSPFAYWVGDAIRRVFVSSAPLASGDRFTRQGLATSDDFRFIRAWSELSPKVVTPSKWLLIAKGGAFARFYRDLHAVVSWKQDAQEMKAFAESRPGVDHWSKRITNTDSYGRPGLTWPLRGITFSAQAVPTGSAFSIAGKMAFAPRSELAAWLAVLNSAPFNYLMNLFAGKVGGVQYESGLIQRTPVPSMSPEASSRLDQLARCGWSLMRGLDTRSQVSHAFVVPAVLQVDGATFEARVAAWAERVAEIEAELDGVQSEIDELCFELYGISEEDRVAITDGFGVSNGESDDEAFAVDDDDDESSVELDPEGLAAGLVSWAVGVAVGRFDVRLATGERVWPEEPDPFDPLPVCSPGMLTGNDGLPLNTPPDGYPIVPSAVLADDPGHEMDLTARVLSVFDIVFGADADGWWSEVGAVLDARNGIEGWLRRGFFDHHLKTYSKSRRKAPIVWPIGTKSGSYRVWLYAHRVTGDTMFRVLGDVVEPKLAVGQRRLSDLTQEFGLSPSASQRRTLDNQQTLVDELIELRDELRAVAPLWAPDLNDGIVIVLAPLWRLFAHHRAWSKELRDRWTKLAKGEHDWAQLAMHIWPERVIPKCADDRSLAIAHDLEDTFWVRHDDNPAKWQPRHTPTTPIDQLTAHHTNHTTTTARTHPTP